MIVYEDMDAETAYYVRALDERSDHIHERFEGKES